ncbi:MAG: hypothetical protein KDA32_03190 [Phycisphaerales bacterium]|nr:hypothetical protein [Phycisphaerales bacterium]
MTDSSPVQVSKPLVALNAGSALLGHAINIGVLVWLQRLLLNSIEPDEYSLYPVIVAPIAFVPLAFSVLSGGLGRFLVEALARNDQARVAAIVATMRPLLLISGVGLAIVGFGAAPFVDTVLSIPAGRETDARLMFALMTLMVAMRVAATPFSVGLFVRQQFLAQNAIILATQVTRLALLCALLFGVSTRVLWVVVATVIAEGLGSVAQAVIGARAFPAALARGGKYEGSVARQLVSFGGWSLALNLAATLRTQADPIILNEFATAVDVTVFYLGSLALLSLQRVAALITGPLNPPLTALHATGRDDLLGTLYLRGGRYALWGVMAVVTPLMVFNRPLLALYLDDPRYITAGVVMALLLGILPLNYGAIMVNKILTARGQLRGLALSVLASQVVNVGLTLVLVIQFKLGALGSAIATFVIAALFEPLVRWPMGLRTSNVGLGQWLRETLAPGLVPAAAATALWVGVMFVAPPSTWLALGAWTLAGWLVYAGVLWFALRSEDRSELARARRAVLR